MLRILPVFTISGFHGGGIADAHAYRERLLGAAYKAAALMES
jgi:hypothetical protein